MVVLNFKSVNDSAAHSTERSGAVTVGLDRGGDGLVLLLTDHEPVDAEAGSCEEENNKHNHHSVHFCFCKKLGYTLYLEKKYEIDHTCISVTPKLRRILRLKFRIIFSPTARS